MTSHVLVKGTGFLKISGSGSANVYTPPPTPPLLVTWGNQTNGGNSTGVDISQGISDVASNRYAFAVIRTDGSVVVWGDSTRGGSITTPVNVSSSLDGTIPVSSIYTAYGGSSFSCIRNDLSVISWGNQILGGDSTVTTGGGGGSPTGIVSMVANGGTFAALKGTIGNHSVVTWGQNASGGNQTVGGTSPSVAASLTSGVVSITANNAAYAALKSNGSVVTWGSSSVGGDSTTLSPAGANISSGVDKVVGGWYRNQSSCFAALKGTLGNYSVVVWGNVANGGSLTSPVNVSASLTSGVYDVGGTFLFMYALKGSPGNHSLITWGNQTSGGNSGTHTPSGESLASGIVSISTTQSAGCVLKEDGITAGQYKAVCWGNNVNGGNQTVGGTSPSVASSLTSGIISVASNQGAFVALKADGTVVTWGVSGYGGDSSVTYGGALTNIANIYSTERSFTAVRNDGTVVTWGDVGYGGDSSTVQSQLIGITNVYATQTAFAATNN